MRVTTVVRVLAYTAVGVVLTFATSLAFSLTQRYRKPPDIFVRSAPGGVIRSDSTPAVMRWERTGSTLLHLTDQHSLDLFGWTGRRQEPSVLTGEWNRPELEWKQAGAGADREYDLIHASGFPLYSFSYRGKSWTASSTAIDGGLQVGKWELAAALRDPVGRILPGRFGGSAAGVLPLTPIWTGILVDTAFYAIASALLVRSVVRVRHLVVSAIRRRGGRCTKCGYSRVGLTIATCPECGWVEKVRA